MCEMCAWPRNGGKKPPFFRDASRLFFVRPSRLESSICESSRPSIFLGFNLFRFASVTLCETKVRLSIYYFAQVYVFEVDEPGDGERGDREKRKIVIPLGVTNGIINFVFGVSLRDTISKILKLRRKNLSYSFLSIKYFFFYEKSAINTTVHTRIAEKLRRVKTRSETFVIAAFLRLEENNLLPETGLLPRLENASARDPRRLQSGEERRFRDRSESVGHHGVPR